ncbi:MAG: T9SS type A sorting domain-containing protein, partial [Microscillaceae bacterium]|nr:T9SS type A sorting domain-containing protein [Microscillaceae bacterium]
FDPGSGTFNLTSAGSADIFVSKLDASGNFLWAKGMGGTDFDRGRGIALDAIRNVHISGDLGTSIFLAKRCPVDYNPQVSIQVSDADLKICQGELLTLTALVQDNTDNPPRVWRRNGLVVGNSNILASNAFNNGDRIALELVYPGFENGYDATCIRNNTASVVVEVRPVVTPSVIIGITSSGLACQGKPVVFKAITTNGGERPSYVWLRKNVGQANFSVVGTNLDNYETSSLANGDIIRVELTNTDIPNCATGKVNTVTSPDFVVGITPSLTASVNLTANIRQGQPICNSDTLVFTAQPVNQGDSPSYEWFINNSKVATTNTPSFRTNQFPANTNPINVYVRMTSNYPCLTNNPVNSPNFSFRTQSSTTPALSLQALDGTSICAGELARFKANPIGGGVEPSYQWFINEAPQGNLSTQDIFGSITFRDGDVIRAEMVSDLNCASPPIVSSAPLVISVRPAPNVEIKSNSGLVVCQGAALTLEAVPSNATSPTYQWRKNGENIVGATNRTYTFNNIQASDNQASIDVVMNSTNVTCKNSRVIANPINLQVSNAFVPSVNLRARQGAVLCEGSLAIFEIASLNVPAATYEWRVDNVVKSTQPLFEAGVLQAGQKVRLSITTTLACANPKTATSTEYVVRTQTLQKPTNLTANTVGNRAIELRWQDNSTGETRFVIERAIGSDNPQNFVTFRNVLDTVSTFFTDTDVLPNTTYFYRVRAVNANIPDCRSAYSDRVGATTDGEDLVTANSPNLETVLEVYPNPSQSGIFYLQWTTGWAGEIKLALFNVLQAQSFGQVLQKNAQSTQTTLDLSHYSAGVYWLKIQVNGRSRFVKLVKY